MKHGLNRVELEYVYLIEIREMLLDLIFPFVYEIRLGKTKRFGKEALEISSSILDVAGGREKKFLLRNTFVCLWFLFAV